MSRLAKIGLVLAAAALTAAGQLTITTTTLPTAVIGQPYSPVALQSSGDAGPIVWNFSGGAPNFLVVSGSSTTGTFCYGSSSCTGSPVQTPVGTYFFTMLATSLSTNQTASRDFTLVVVNPLQIVTASLPNAPANTGYSTTLQGFGGTGNFVWSILAGALPPGITLADPVHGVLAGTAPPVNNTYPFTVQLQDQATLATVTRLLSITVVNGIGIITTSLPNATVNQGYSFQLQGTGQNLVWSVPTGAALPMGWNLSQGGLITGVGTSPGALSFPISLANGQFPNAAAFRLFTLLVTLGPLSIIETTLPGATQNVPYSAILTPSGGIPPYTWGLGISNLQGITINSSSGIISGTPTTAGSFPLLVTLRDSSGAFVTQNYTLNVGTGVSVSTTSLPAGPPNIPYSFTLTAAAGSVPYRWSLVTGTLPPGLTLNQATGQISGTPTALGTYPITVQVTDSLGGFARRDLSIVIAQVLAITTLSLPDATLSQQYTQTLNATAGAPPYTWTIPSGALPIGLTLNATTGVIGGTATSAGTFTFDVLVTDSARAVARRTLTIQVPLLITTGDLAGTVLTAFLQNLAVTGGIAPYTWSVTSGTLPTGLQLSTAGVISGTPGAGGTSPVGFTATDSNGLTGTKTINITILLPPTPATSITLGTTTQPAVALTTGAPYPLEITGFLTLTFASSAGGTDDMIRFSNGTRSLEYILRANQTQAIFPTAANAAIVTGTVAGTITLTASMTAGGQNVAPSPAPTTTIVIDPAVPVISSVALQQVTGGLSVVVTGYSNTREVSSGSFTFTVSSGNTLSQATLTVPLTSAYAAWFGNTASNATGGQFKLTVPFSVTQGSAAAVTKVSVTLTNTKGASAAVSSQ